MPRLPLSHLESMAIYTYKVLMPRYLIRVALAETYSLHLPTV